MTILFNADKNLTIHEEFRDKLKEQLSDQLSRFSDKITRLEVHLSDENGYKDGQNDKRCVIEARVERRRPFVVTADADNYELAVDASAEKLITILDSLWEQVSAH
jgi:ribosome-associated translation inhibitor RaiA